MNTTISMNEVKNLLNYTIDNNFRLEEEGKKPIAICFEAEAGIGKTSIVQQIAEERNMTCTKLSLHELDEAGDLIGYPQVEYECQIAKKVKDADGNIKLKVLPNTVWMNTKQLEGQDKSVAVRQTGKTRMAYAKPAWVPEYNENGNLFLMDDFGRCNQQLMQAVMELITTRGYVSWKLPKKSCIVLTSNPDNGSYNINSMDPAQRTRFMGYTVEFSEDAWARWAEKTNMDGRCINFVLTYSKELFGVDDNGDSICNPRSFEMFANMISGIKDWEDPSNLSFISTIAKGCFKDESGRFSKMFSAYIINKMHKLIQPKDMLLGAWDRIRTEMEGALYDGNNYRPDIATLLERRFSNYVLAWLGSGDKTPIATVKNRILDFIDNEEKHGKVLFSRDLFLHMIKTITSEYKSQTNHLLYETKIAKMLS